MFPFCQLVQCARALKTEQEKYLISSSVPFCWMSVVPLEICVAQKSKDMKMIHQQNCYDTTRRLHVRKNRDTKSGDSAIFFCLPIEMIFAMK